MSLFEQAIARLREQQGKSSVPTASSGPLKSRARPTAEKFEDPETLAKRWPVNLEALRAAGYLPEKEKDRQFADHYRRIKRPLIDTALSKGAAGRERIIMVASAVPGDGKTFTSLNLALSMALERDISVLLIDADASKQHITEIFELSGQKGLLDALLDSSCDPEALVVPTNTRGLALLPAGRRVEGATELMSSTRMRDVLASLCANNPRRILLLDSPPLLITNEGRALLKMAGQVALVVRAGETPRHAVQAAVELFDETQTGGLILNQVKVGLTEGYYGYGAYSAYGVKDDES